MLKEAAGCKAKIWRLMLYRADGERATNTCWCAPPIEAEHRDARGLTAAGSVDLSASLGLLLAGLMLPIVIRFPTVSSIFFCFLHMQDSVL